MTTISLAQVWPEWEIEKQIGRGSYGVVYQAVRGGNDLTSRAAIKVISIPQDPYEIESLRAEGMDLNASRTYLKQIVDEFINEIRLMETFKGIQNIVSIEDYKVLEKEDGIGWDIYIRMELLTPLNTYICDKELNEQEIIRLGCDICTALTTCAKCNIIHRDIKPENIFVNSFGNFKLGDFGTARKMENLFCGLSQKGTYNYMAPEVMTEREYDGRVDIYSLGLVLYRLMNGNRLPFISEKQLLSPGERQSAFERRMHGEALPAPCNASKELADVILKACAYHREDRFADAGEMKQALLQVQNGTGMVTEKTPKKNRAPLLTAILLSGLILIGAGGALFISKYQQTADSTPESMEEQQTADSTPESREEQVIQPVPEGSTEASGEQEQEPLFQFENVYVDCNCVYNEETGVGYNAAGETIRWCLLVEFDLPKELQEKYKETITCSWDKVVNGSNDLWVEEASFETAKSGMTYAEFGIMEAVYSDTGTDRFIYWLFLPDNPSIEGEQSVTVSVGDEELHISFQLVYDGDYETGMGWHIIDVRY